MALPKARVQLRSLGNQVLPERRSILKQKNNNQRCNPPGEDTTEAKQ
jgi:hypothetical protein